MSLWSSITLLELLQVIRVITIALLENIYSTGITHVDQNMLLSRPQEMSLIVFNYAPRVVNYTPREYL
jgi:hypothetical protein